MAKRKHDFEDTDCPVCHEQLYPPVYQCCKGHMLCCSCYDTIEQRRQPCPTCRGTLPNPRVECLLFRQIAKLLEYECPFPGCSQKLSFDQVLGHKESCQRRPFKCGWCEELHGTAEMVVHMQQKHLDHGVRVIPNETIDQLPTITKNGRSNIKVEMMAPRNSTTVFCMGDVLFLVEVLLIDGTVYAYVVARISPAHPNMSYQTLSCKLSVIAESKLSFSGPVYKYDDWNEADVFDKLVPHGRRFVVARSRSKVDWTCDDSHFLFSLRISFPF